MNLLTLDIWGYLSEFVKSNKDKCYLMMTCKEISECRFFFRKIIEIKKITNTIWFDHFTNVVVDDLVTLPKFIERLMFDSDKPVNGYIPTSVNSLIFGRHFDWPIYNCIPSSVTFLVFGNYFNQPIKGCIPMSVTHLSFDYHFNQSIEDSIPSSVIELNFGFSFNQSIKNCIPLSVKCLILGEEFDQPIKDCIPFGVTHLTFWGAVDQSIENCIPSSVIHLRFYGYFNQSISTLPSSVTHLILDSEYSHYQDIPSSIKQITFMVNDKNDRESYIIEQFRGRSIDLNFRYC